MKIDGSCHCGNIIFEAEVDPEKVLICHCTDCQTLSGTAYRTVAPVTDNLLQLLRGELREQSFCPDCGSPIYAGPVEGDSGMLGIRVGAIRQRDQLAPQKQYYRDSAQQWVQDLSEVTRIKS
jgi:hypothetical protein